VAPAAAASSAAPPLKIETPRTATAVIHGENVDEVLANHVEDAVREATEACTAHPAVLNGVGLGMTRDPRQARIHGAK